MDRKKAGDLIEKIWVIEKQLKAVQKNLTIIERAIADEVPEEK